MTERMTIKEIAEVTGANPKTIRAYLRRNATRDADVKGSRWGSAKEGYSLTVKLSAALVEHFTSDEDEEATEEA